MFISDNLHPLFTIELQGFRVMIIKDSKKPTKGYVKTF